MIAKPLPKPPRIRDLPLSLLNKRFSTATVELDYGAAVVRVQSDLESFVGDFQRVYGAFVLPEQLPFSDFHTRMCAGKGLRAFLRPQSRFLIDGIQPFDPFPPLFSSCAAPTASSALSLCWFVHHRRWFTNQH